MMRGYLGGAGVSYGIGGFGVLLCILIMLLVIALIIIAVLIIVRLIRHGSRPLHPGEFNRPPVSPSLEILSQRLAKGEITLDEYQRLKAELFKP